MPRAYACHWACRAVWGRLVALALLDGRFLKSHRVELAYQPIRACFLRFVLERRVLRFVWVHPDVQVPLGVGARLFQDVGGLQHRPYGEERVCRRVRVVALGVWGCWFWLGRPRVVGSQDGVEPQHGRRFAASGPGAHRVAFSRPDSHKFASGPPRDPKIDAPGLKKAQFPHDC